MQRGRFITLEGGEGTGKSTQVQRLVDFFVEKGLDVLVTREPGGSEGAEMIRPLLVSGHYPWELCAEYLLFSAARSDHLSKVILPALESGTWVICDRFFDSSFVYQGIVQGLDVEFMRTVYNGLSRGVYPDLTIVLDVQTQQALARVTARHGIENRFEQKGMAFHEAVRSGFLDLANHEAHRMRVVDASGDTEDVARMIQDVVQYFFMDDPSFASSKE